MNRLQKAALALTFLLGASAAATAEPFSDLVGFSGALTDTGNMASEKGDYAPPLYKNRNTNGLVAYDILAQRLGLKSDASMHLVGKPGGSNYAVSDALAGGNGPHDLPAQVDAYLARHDGKADPKALYFVFIGGNDVVLAAMTPDDAKSAQLSKAAVDGIEVAIKRLVAAGAKTIFAPDFIDIGLAPGLKMAGPAATARATQLSKDYNKNFNAMLDKIDDGSFELIRWSFGDFVDKLVQHGNEFGFTNVSDSCADFIAKGTCDYDKFVFYNYEYPTARVHELVGSAMALAVLERK